MKEGVRVVNTYDCRAGRATPSHLINLARVVAILRVREDQLVSRRLQGNVGDAAAVRAVQII
jgi:hypothetical protein